MNAISPNKDQVEALDAYLDVAIWNELMREHQKDYRVHNFLMEAPNTSPDGRGYAYPHIYNTFFSMYKIASTYPELTDYRGYLSLCGPTTFFLYTEQWFRGIWCKLRHHGREFCSGYHRGSGKGRLIR